MKYTWNDKPIQPGDTSWLQEDGVHKVYYFSGALMYEEPYVNGQWHGVLKGYYESGALRYKAPWLDGQAHGVHKQYYESGVLYYERLYVNDQLREDLKDNRLAKLVLFGVEI